MKLARFAILVLALSPAGHAQPGLVSHKSAFDVATTVARLESALQDKGMGVLARIDHAAAAARVGVTLRPTVLLIFGKPLVGSALMACRQSVAIDLPQKALISEDENQQVWLSYNDPHYLVTRHRIAGCAALLETLAQALEGLARQATQSDQPAQP